MRPHRHHLRVHAATVALYLTLAACSKTVEKDQAANSASSPAQSTGALKDPDPAAKNTAGSIGAQEAADESVSSGPAWFKDVAALRGLSFQHQSGHLEAYLMPEVVCGGGALFDFDNDGDLDAYLVQSGSLYDDPAKQPGNQLFENDGAAHFADVSDKLGADDRGYGMGVAAADLSGDGSVDLYVTNLRENALYWNRAGKAFEQAADSVGANQSGWGTSALAFDAEGDGDLDLFVVNYLDWRESIELDCQNHLGQKDYCGPASYNAPARDALLLNDGEGQFLDASEESGVAAERGTGLGVSAADFDSDGHLDVFVANDGMPDHLWHNHGQGKFENIALEAGCALDQEGLPKAGMGVAIADIDEDGDSDLYICNLKGESDSVYTNEGGWFSDRTSRLGLRLVSRPFTRFGLGWIDFDNDTYFDLFQANGRVARQAVDWSDDPYAEPNLLYRGSEDGRFHEILPRGGTAQALNLSSRAAAFGDVDGDGGMDILVVNRDGPANLLLNQHPGRGHWLLVRLMSGNSDALHAELDVELEERVLHRDARAAYSYLASNDPRVHVGLGAETLVKRLVVRWADGTRESFPCPAIDRLLVLERGRGTELADSAE